MADSSVTTADLKTKWDDALRKLAETQSAYDHYTKTIWDPAYQREKAFEEQHGLDSSVKFKLHDRAMALHAAHPGNRIPDELNTAVDILGEAASKAEDDLMKMEAPDLAALKWKIDRLLRIENADGEDGGSTACWCADYVQQTIIDCDRLLKA